MSKSVFITKAELAVRWMVCTKTIETWVKIGQCPRPVKLTPRRLRFRLEDIERHEDNLK